MNKFFDFAIDFPAEKLVSAAILLGFIIGSIKGNWAMGIAYGIFAPFTLIPVILLIAFLGILYKFFTRN